MTKTEFIKYCCEKYGFSLCVHEGLFSRKYEIRATGLGEIKNIHLGGTEDIVTGFFIGWATGRDAVSMQGVMNQLPL